MDILSLILRSVREQIEALGVPPDPLQEALLEAEMTLRRSLGGAQHHISRLPSTKARILDLAAEGLTAAQICERLGVTYRYARQVMALAGY